MRSVKLSSADEYEFDRVREELDISVDCECRREEETVPWVGGRSCISLGSSCGGVVCVLLLG